MQRASHWSQIVVQRRRRQRKRNEQGEGGAESLYLTNKNPQNKNRNNNAKQTASILCLEVVIFAMFVCFFFNEGVLVCVCVLLVCVCFPRLTEMGIKSFWDMVNIAEKEHLSMRDHVMQVLPVGRVRCLQALMALLRRHHRQSRSGTHLASTRSHPAATRSIHATSAAALSQEEVIAAMFVAHALYVQLATPAPV